MRIWIRFFSLILLAQGVSAIAQDLTIVSKLTRDRKPEATTISYLARDHVRMAHGDGKELIVDFRSGQMTTLDARNRTYYLTTREDMEQLAARMRQQMNSPEVKKAQEQLKNLPPEERKKVEAGLGGIAGAFDVRKAGTTRRIAGYLCEDWTIAFGELSRSDECLTRELQFPVQAWDMYREFAESMQSMMAAFGPMAGSLAQMREKLKNMKGFPLSKTTKVNILGNWTTTTTEVAEIRRDPIPASVWEVPGGYRKVDNPMLRALRSSK